MTCPDCAVPMRLCDVWQGKNHIGRFWVCPKCKRRERP